MKTVNGPLPCDVRDIQKNIFDRKPLQNVDFK